MSGAERQGQHNADNDVLERPGLPEPALASFAQKVVRGAVTFMAVTTVAATVTGFWLSYAGLHSFALRSGLHGAEAWAWPASVDLFIMVGELGLTVSAIRHIKDPLAWGYLLAGFGPSVVFNVLHVAAVTPAWGRYAVAAVPPVAAMLALAALMRQVFRLAVEEHLTTAPAPGTAPGNALAPAPGAHPDSGPGAHPESAPPDALATHPESAPEDAPAPGRAPHPDTPGQPTRDRTRSRTRKRPEARTRSAPVTEHDAEAEFIDELAAGTVPSQGEIRARLHVGQDRARQLQDHMRSLAISRT